MHRFSMYFCCLWLRTAASMRLPGSRSSKNFLCQLPMPTKASTFCGRRSGQWSSFTTSFPHRTFWESWSYYMEYGRCSVMNKTFLFIMLGGTFFSAFSQILLKQSANIKYSNPLREYLNWRVILAYFLFFGILLLNPGATQKSICATDRSLIPPPMYSSCCSQRWFWKKRSHEANLSAIWSSLPESLFIHCN